jgi:hypothetical protein
MQQYDPNLRPSEIVFDKMAVWIRIYDLPFGLMNKRWGWKLAEKVGTVMKVEVDSQGRAWGAYFRAKVQINLSKPLMRCVSMFSEKRQMTVRFDVKYEKLPNYCYSCGLIGHSSVICPTPAERDEQGLLPYGKDLRVADDTKQKKGFDEKHYNSVVNNINLGRQRGSCEDILNAKRSGNKGNMSGVSGSEGRDLERQNEEISPLEKQDRKGKKSIYDKEVENVSKEIFPISLSNQGVKRKQPRTPRARPNFLNQGGHEDNIQDEMALIVSDPHPTQIKMQQDMEDFDPEEKLEEMCRRMKKSKTPTKEISAEAARQPRQEP